MYLMLGVNMDLQKTEDANYSRDTDTHAVINTNVAAYNEYKRQRQASKTVAEYQQQVSNLTNEIAELKSLIKTIIEKKDG